MRTTHSGARGGTPGRLRTMPDRIRRYGARAWRAQWPVYCEIVLFVVLDLAYEVLRALVAPDPAGVRGAFRHAHSILRTERAIGVAIESWAQRVTDAVAGGRFVDHLVLHARLYPAVHRLFCRSVVPAKVELRVRAELVLDRSWACAHRVLGLSGRSPAVGGPWSDRHDQAGPHTRRGPRLVSAPAQRIRGDAVAAHRPVVPVRADPVLAVPLLGSVAQRLVGAAGVDGVGDVRHRQPLRVRWPRGPHRGRRGVGDRELDIRRGYSTALATRPDGRRNQYPRHRTATAGRPRMSARCGLPW